MLHLTELLPKPFGERLAQPQRRPGYRSLQNRAIAFRGWLRRGGASAGPMVRNLLRKREVRRLGMGRRAPHRPTSRHDHPADGGCHVHSIAARTRGPPAWRRDFEIGREIFPAV